MWGTFGGSFGVFVVVAWAAALCWWDFRHRRLPNWLTLPAAALSLFWFSPAALIWPGLYLGLGLVRGGIGGGDIKLAVPLGVVVAQSSGVGGVLAAIVLANILTVVAAALLHLLGQRRDHHTHPQELPHGPAMLAGAGIIAVV